MDESKPAIYTHIQKPEDYKILNDPLHENGFVVKTELGDVIVTFDWKVAIMLAMDLVKIVAAKMKQEVNKEITDLTDLGN